MKRLQYRYCLIVPILLLTTGFAHSQGNDEDKWIRIKDDKSEFSILFPPNFLIDNEIEKSYILAPVLASLPEPVDLYEKPKIIANRKSVTMSLSIYQLRNVSAAKNYLWYFVGQDTPKANFQDFQIGDFVGRKITFDAEKGLATSVVIATKNKVYLINASAKKEDEEIYRQFVTSLVLNGNQPFKSQTSEPADTLQSVLTSTLRTSQEILDALNQKHEKSEIRVTKSTAAAQNEGRAEQNFSRPMILLRQPPAAFTDDARRRNTSGYVKLKVTFLASGKIGDIVVVSELPHGLTESSIKAAQKIRFLPAEIDGKKVDVTSTIEYACVKHSLGSFASIANCAAEIELARRR
jgi:TonB family protein